MCIDWATPKTYLLKVCLYAHKIFYLRFQSFYAPSINQEKEQKHDIFNKQPYLLVLLVL